MKGWVNPINPNKCAAKLFFCFFFIWFEWEIPGGNNGLLPWSLMEIPEIPSFICACCLLPRMHVSKIKDGRYLLHPNGCFKVILLTSWITKYCDKRQTSSRWISDRWTPPKNSIPWLLGSLQEEEGRVRGSVPRWRASIFDGPPLVVNFLQLWGTQHPRNPIVVGEMWFNAQTDPPLRATTCDLHFIRIHYLRNTVM